MTYEITEHGIRYHMPPTTEQAAEEMETDRLVDEWHERQPGFIQREITQSEIDATIKRVSREIEALG